MLEPACPLILIELLHQVGSYEKLLDNYYDTAQIKSCNDSLCTQRESRTDEIDLDEVANSFISVNERRSNYFGHIQFYIIPYYHV